MEKHLLSKSTFIRALQCEKSLYLHKKRPFLRDKLSAEQRAKFDRGTHIGEIARELFPGGINLAPKGPSQYQPAVSKTAKAIDEGQEVIYEATFQYDKILVILDILVYKNGKFYAYEVKSSAKISSTYLTDAALQYYVITNSGLELEDIFIIYVNPEYRLKGNLDIKQFFYKQSVKDLVIEKQSMIAEKIRTAKESLQLKKSPPIDIGEHCYDPYPCDFRGHCWKHIKENSVFELLHLDREKQFELYQNQQVYINDLDINNFSGQGRIEIEAFQTQKPYFNWKQINKFRYSSKEQYFVMDIVFINPAIPMLQKMAPYELIPALVTIQDQKKQLVYEWQLNPAQPDFSPLFNQFEKINRSRLPVFTFMEDNAQADYLKSKMVNGVYNLYELFAEMYYIEPRLHGDIHAANIAARLLDDNPFHSKDMIDKKVASIKLNSAFSKPEENRKELLSKVKAFVEQQLKFDCLLLKHINELI
ncbi:MAG: hypothetical protein ACOCPM_03860 [Bacteroidales bacterium]